MDQQYYILKPSLDEKETGKAYPAVISYPDYDFDGPRSIYKIRSDHFPDFVPDLRFKLARGAKLCDMMTEATSSAGLILVSQRFHVFILSNAILPSHRFCDCFIETKDGIIKYYFLHLVNPELIEYIDFEKTIFYKKKYSDNLGLLNINSYSEYQAIKSELGTRFMIGIEKMTLIRPIPYDIFQMPLIYKMLISEKFYEKLNLQCFTGIETKPHNLTF